MSTPIARYFSALESAILALERAAVSRDQGPWGTRPHDILGAVLTHTLNRLESSAHAWAMQARYQDRFQIALKESGFPAFREVLALNEARSMADKHLLTLPTPTEIRGRMVDQILSRRQHPRSLQKQMAERLFYQHLRLQGGPEGIFPPFTKPRTFRLSHNPKNKRPYYVVYWSCYDGAANLPLIYTAVIEDSTKTSLNGGADKAFAAATSPKPGKAPPPSAHWGMDGLPNPQLSEKFAEFAEAQSAYSLTLTTIATAMDKDFPTLHPKQLRRFNLGPFYVGGITQHNETVQGLLDTVDLDSNNWLLTWTMQELLSKAEQPGKRGFFSNTPAKQEFYINTDDIDCAQQGVSAVDYHALVPHSAYQAVYASGKAGDVFGRYKVSVVSGNDVIRQV